MVSLFAGDSRRYRPALRDDRRRRVRARVGQAWRESERDRNDQIAIFTSSWKIGRLGSCIRDASVRIIDLKVRSRIGVGVESAGVAAVEWLRVARRRAQPESVVDSRDARGASRHGTISISSAIRIR